MNAVLERTQKKSVLIVDDEEIVRDLFKRFLSRQGFEATTVEDGFDAIEKMKEHNYDLVLLDLKMPRMDGITLLDKMNELHKDPIKIVVTGYAAIETAKEALRKGCFDYITKPVDLENLDHLVQKAFQIRALADDKRRLQEQFLRAEKLASLAQLGAGVAHEVNTVLASVKMYLEMQRQKVLYTEEGKSIGILLDELGHVDTMIQRFISFSKPSDGTLSVVDVNVVIEHSISFLRSRMNRQSVTVLTEFNPDPPLLRCDAVRIEEVFLNILMNSIEAMPEGGTVTVKTIAESGKITVTVADTGKGFSAESMDKAFTPFFTTKPGNTGLGLAIVHRVIDDHRGTVRISNQKDSGAMVIVEFPLSPEISQYTTHRSINPDNANA